MILPKQELRIGNILSTDGGYVIVTGLPNKGGHLDSEPWPHKHENRGRFGAIQAVELTEDIIQRCGGVSHGNGFYDWEYIRPIFLQKVHDGWDLVFNPGTITKRPIKYLHQLQNLYYDLTGNELNFSHT